MKKIFEKIKFEIRNNKGLIVIASLALFLLIPSVFVSAKTQSVGKREVLGAASVVSSTPTDTLSPTITPTFSPTSTPAPTETPVLTSSPTPSVSPTPSSAVDPTSSPTLAPTVILTPSPTPVSYTVQIGIDYAGERPSDSYTTTVTAGQTAWNAVVAAVGVNNLQYTDYGGDMGIFITSFNGVAAASNQYYEFRVNGVSSDIGVSSYQCNDGDKLDFVLTSF